MNFTCCKKAPAEKVSNKLKEISEVLPNELIGQQGRGYCYGNLDLPISVDLMDWLQKYIVRVHN